ncbi:hypothetical protein IU433_30205 [Nocardia puris]|uniref:hypothetical protein n=1 Tax=Nocardia puris TaxID=208602 RepID=UPI0009FE7699|nr:hypothetical protein [Nocardia puris]MBF6215483.1 hypothetical protein [Nocardia puris]MBF6370382.1 hypothetical protein [Nocardia puris]MBF6463278.1 hypothetical protein [Nocardia puris]
MLPHPAPVVLDVARQSKAKSAAGIAVAGAFGAFAVLSALTDRLPGGVVTKVLGLLFGGFLLLIALGGALAWRLITRPRRLVIGPEGLSWDDPAGRSWTVGWGELSAVAVSRTVNRRPTMLPPTAMVRLDLFPAGPGFRDRHPEMEHLWEFHRVRGGYRLPFGQEAGFVPVLDDGLRRFGGARYRGVQDEGFTVGLF